MSRVGGRRPSIAHAARRWAEGVRVSRGHWRSPSSLASSVVDRLSTRLTLLDVGRSRSKRPRPVGDVNGSAVPQQQSTQPCAAYPSNRAARAATCNAVAPLESLKSTSAPKSSSAFID